MFVLQCEITIGKYVFHHVAEVKITASRTALSTLATIKLPQKYSGQYLAAVIQPGDEVEIKLGYKPALKTEFTGYVVEVNPNIPVEIKCEDEMYQLKRKHPKAKTFASATLKEVLAYMVPGSRLEVPVVNLTNFKLDGKGSIAYALKKIKEAYGLDIYYRGKTLFAGLAYTDTEAIKAGDVVYNLQKNVINPKLNWRKVADVRLKVKAISILPDNTKLEYTAGDDDGALITRHYYNLTSEAELKVQAEQTLKHNQYAGFEGSILTFGRPYCIFGQVADIIDPRFKSRKGRHFIDKTIVTFGTQGFRREVFLGRKAG
jgi:hypothetical protein